MTEPADLERRLGRALRDLPTPRAPGSLVTRVMAEVDSATAADTAAVRRATGWRAWPRRWQLSAVVALCAVASAVTWLPGLGAVTTPAAGAQLLSGLSSRAQQLTLAAAALRLVWDVTVQPFVPYAVGIAVVMGVAFAVLGITLTYVASGRTWEQ